MTTLKEETFAKEIFAEFIFAIYDLIRKNLFRKNKANSKKTLGSSEKTCKKWTRFAKICSAEYNVFALLNRKISSAKQRNVIAYTGFLRVEMKI